MGFGVNVCMRAHVHTHWKILYKRACGVSGGFRLSKCACPCVCVGGFVNIGFRNMKLSIKAHVNIFFCAKAEEKNVRQQQEIRRRCDIESVQE